MLLTLIAATVLNVIPAESPVAFHAVGKPGFLKIDGTGAQLEGSATLEGTTLLSGLFTVKLSALKTGIETRDEHMKKKYLDTATYEQAKLELIKAVDRHFDGKLTLKGNTQPVSGTYELKPDNSGSAAFQIKLANYPEIGVPSYLGVTVADTVDVDVKFKTAKP